MMRKVELVAGDTLPNIDTTLQDGATGTAIDLSNASDVIKFYFRLVGSTATPTAITCTKPNGGSDGIVRIGWTAGQITAGEFDGEFEITYASGKIQTVFEKIRLSVRSAIGP